MPPWPYGLGLRFAISRPWVRVQVVPNDNLFICLFFCSPKDPLYFYTLSATLIKLPKVVLSTWQTMCKNIDSILDHCVLVLSTVDSILDYRVLVLSIVDSILDHCVLVLSTVDSILDSCKCYL